MTYRHKRIDAAYHLTKRRERRECLESIKRLENAVFVCPKCGVVQTKDEMVRMGRASVLEPQNDETDWFACRQCGEPMET